MNGRVGNDNHMNGDVKMNGSVVNSELISDTETVTPSNTSKAGALNTRSSTSPASTLNRTTNEKQSTLSNGHPSTNNLMTSGIDSLLSEADKPKGLVVAMHRKMVSYIKKKP